MGKLRDFKVRIIGTFIPNLAPLGFHIFPDLKKFEAGAFIQVK